MEEQEDKKGKREEGREKETPTADCTEGLALVVVPTPPLTLVGCQCGCWKRVHTAVQASCTVVYLHTVARITR